MDPFEHFDRVRGEVDSEDVDALLGHLDQQRVQTCLDLARTRMQARHIRGGAAKLLASRVRGGPPRPAFDISGVLIEPMIEEGRSLLGDRADDPSIDDLRELVTPLEESFTADTLALMLGWLASSEMVAADAAASLLDELRPPEPQAPRIPEPVEPATDETEDHERALFTTLDEALIRSVVAASNDTIGAFSRPDVRALVDEVVKLNSSRHSSWFHVGFLEALDDDWTPEHPDAGMNDDRRTWLVFGLLSGHTRRQDWAAVRARVLEDWESVQAIVADTAMGSSVTRPLVLSLLEAHPRRAADVLAIRQGSGGFSGWQETLRHSHERARTLLNEQRIPEARALWTSLGTFPEPVLAHLDIDVTRRLVTCARAADDFVAATRLLDDIDPHRLSDAERAVFHTERGLVAAEVQHLRHVSLGTAEHEEHVAARLEKGREHFEAALEVDPYEWRANLCLGVVDHHAGRSTASARLQLALSGMQDDPVLTTSDLPSEVRFHAALARLRTLEPGVDGPAFADLKTACSDHWRPDVEAVTTAGDLFLTYRSRHAADWLLLAQDLLRSPAPLAPLTLELVRQSEHRVVELARSLARSRKVPCEQRLALLTGLLDHMRALSSADEEVVLDELDDLLRAVDDPDTDRAYAQWLDTSTARELLGATEARLRQVEVRRRLGELELARQTLESVIHRAVTDGTGAYSGASLLEVYRELDPEPEDVNRLGALVAPPRAPSVATGDRVRLVFVGGDERQASERERLEDELATRHDGTVSVNWIFPGWSSNWARHAETAESMFDTAAALVLMPLVRTNLGRRLRRTSGEAGIPWIACTGHGREAILRAIDEAVAVARR